MSEQKRVYTFGAGKAEGNAEMREQLGGKGANLAEMNLIGVPVPPGFTITTDCCNEYYEVGQEKIKEILDKDVTAAVKHIEDLMESKFGDAENPLLVSVRSGARASMPGMMVPPSTRLAKPFFLSRAAKPSTPSLLSLGGVTFAM